MPYKRLDITRKFPRHVTEREAWENLGNAIISQAVLDACYLIADKPPLYTSSQYGQGVLTLTDCMNFFHSDYFTLLTDIDPEYIIDFCKRKAAEL